MANGKYEVHLTETERRKLIAMVSKGRNKAVVIQRAHSLLKVDEGQSDAEISELLYVSEQTIRRVRLRFAECWHLPAWFFCHCNNGIKRPLWAHLVNSARRFTQK